MTLRRNDEEASASRQGESTSRRGTPQSQRARPPIVVWSSTTRARTGNARGRGRMHMVNQATLPNATPIKLRPGAKGVLWMAIGAVPFLIFILVVPHFFPGTDTASQLASKAERVAGVGQMQLDLATASEAEKSAVLSSTDHASQTFADQARAASAKVNEERQEVEGLLTAGGTPGERDLLAQFTTAFGELQRVDDELLALAVQNTNIK